jgi:hypothetical protein
MIDSRAATSPLLYRSPGFYPAQMASMSEGLSGMPSLTHQYLAQISKPACRPWSF